MSFDRVLAIIFAFVAAVLVVIIYDLERSKPVKQKSGTNITYACVSGQTWIFFNHNAQRTFASSSWLPDKDGKPIPCEN